jgi:hypothetical protein
VLGGLGEIKIKRLIKGLPKKLWVTGRVFIALAKIAKRAENRRERQPVLEPSLACLAALARSKYRGS